MNHLNPTEITVFMAATDHQQDDAQTGRGHPSGFAGARRLRLQTVPRAAVASGPGAQSHSSTVSPAQSPCRRETTMPTRSAYGSVAFHGRFPAWRPPDANEAAHMDGQPVTRVRAVSSKPTAPPFGRVHGGAGPGSANRLVGGQRVSVLLE